MSIIRSILTIFSVNITPCCTSRTMKAKARKTSSSKTKTVDSEHRHLSSVFQETAKKCKDMTVRLKELREDLRKATEEKNWEQVIALKDDISALKDEIAKTKVENDEVDYLMNTGRILFNYYNTFDDDYKPSTIEECTQNNSKSILNFFASAKTSAKTENSTQPTTVPTQQTHGFTKRGGLYEQYMEIVDKNFVRSFPQEDNDVCSFCKCKTKEVVVGEGVTYCSTCNTVEKTLLEVEKPSYKEPPTEVTYYAYRRINHLNEWLNQSQGKEYTDIPQEIIDNIIIELNKTKVTNMATVTQEQIKKILKKMKCNKYYEHSAYILYKLNGIPPPRLGEELEEKLRQMFYLIEEPYSRHALPTRKNFLSYAYVLHKFLQLLGKEEFLKYFPLLKSRDKLHVQEMIWKKICTDLGWPFIRSI